MSADTTALQKGLKGAKGHMNKLSGALKMGAVAGGAALAGLGVASVKLGLDFEKSMAEVKTLLPDITEKAFGKMKDDVLKFSAEMGIATDKAVPALYQAISAGVPKENVMEFMEVAAKAAIGGVTELETAVDGITSVVNAYGSEVLSAQKASDLMFTAVRLGKTDFNQLSNSLFNVVPTAASLGIGLDEVAASLAVMTAQGVPTSVATTSLRQAFVEASKGGTKLDEAIKKLSGGEGLGALVAEGETASSVFEALRKSMPEQDFKDLFGSVEAMNAVLQITGPNADKMADALAEMGASSGATNKAFDTMAATASFKLNKAINQVKVGMTILGGKILPVLIEGFEKVTTFIQQRLIPAFRDWWEKHGPGVMSFLRDTASLLRSILVPALDTLRDAWAAIAPVIEQHVLPVLKKVGKFLLEHKPLLIAIAAAILLLVSPWLAVAAAIVVVLAKWDAISQFFSKDVPAAIDDFLDKIGEIPIIGEIFKGAFEEARIIVETVFALIKTNVETAINAIKDIIQIVTAIIHGDWDEAWTGIKNLVTGIWIGIYNNIVIVLDAIKQILWNRIRALKDVAEDAWGLVETYFKETIPDWFKNNWKDILIGVFGGIPALLMWKFRDKLADAVIEVSTSLKQKGESIAGWIKEGVAILPGKIKQIAIDTVNAFWDGLKSMKDWIIEKVTGFFGDIAGAAKDAIGDLIPGSPSKFGLAVGRGFGEGIALGIEQMMPAVTNAMTGFQKALAMPTAPTFAGGVTATPVPVRGVSGGGGREVHIHFDGPLLGDQRQLEEIADRLEPVLRRRLG